MVPAYPIAREAYVSFMEETGAEYLGRMMMRIYFRKKIADGPFDSFADIDSGFAIKEKRDLKAQKCICKTERNSVN